MKPHKKSLKAMVFILETLFYRNYSIYAKKLNFSKKNARNAKGQKYAIAQKHF